LARKIAAIKKEAVEVRAGRNSLPAGKQAPKSPFLPVRSFNKGWSLLARASNFIPAARSAATIQFLSKKFRAKFGISRQNLLIFLYYKRRLDIYRALCLFKNYV